MSPIHDNEPGDDESPVAHALRAACLAGAYTFWGRKEPGAAPGLERIAKRERATIKAYLNEVVRRYRGDA